MENIYEKAGRFLNEYHKTYCEYMTKTESVFKIYCARLVFRVAVFITAIQIYLQDKNSLNITNNSSLSDGIKPLHILWLVLAVEMAQKFFPQKITSMGCRKQFKSAYLPSQKRPGALEIAALIKAENAAAKKVFAVWFGGNAVVAVLYYARVLSESEMVLLSLFYSVCDLLGLLLFCPFQSFILKNRCCVTCRIFNWDSIMMLTPLIFVRNFFSWSLVLVALFLLIRWEVTYRRYPQRFLEESNENLQCRHCHEKICRIKRHVYFGKAGLRYLKIASGIKKSEKSRVREVSS